MCNVLVNRAGHSHVEVIRRWAEERIESVKLRAVEPNPTPIDSGIVPGFIAGQYERDELEIDLGDNAEATLGTDPLDGLDPRPVLALSPTGFVLVVALLMAAGAAAVRRILPRTGGRLHLVRG